MENLIEELFLYSYKLEARYLIVNGVINIFGKFDWLKESCE